MSLLNPIKQKDRVPVVDSLRGLALLGIMVANIPFAEGNTNQIYDSSRHLVASQNLDSTLETLISLFIDKKFITIFSILFGFGFYIQLQRAREQGINFEGYYLRRMLALLVIGSVHAYFFWFGDIIRDYAICGMFLLLIYRWKTKKILITGIVFTVFLTALTFIINGALEIPDYRYDTSIIHEHPVTDSYWRYLQINATIDPFVNFLQDSPITLIFCFGNMLIGYWLGKTKFFETYPGSRKLSKSYLFFGLVIGIACSYLFIQVTNGALELTAGLIWLPFVIVAGMLLQSCCYILLFMHLFQIEKVKNILSLFAPVGQMALTNYILQTSLYLLVFFHWTGLLKLYGKVSFAETVIVGILFFTVQVLFSRWWMKTRLQGPVESIWKKFSYRFTSKKFQSQNKFTSRQTVKS